jgi:hypothetical protein
MTPSDPNSTSRAWADYKKISDLTKGKFSDHEVALLKNSLCQYVKDSQIGEEGLMKLVSEKIPPLFKKAWPRISEVLPNRSVQSCHNVIRRRFNPNNYRGKWSDSEEIMLINLVEKFGREWEKIAIQLSRTATNVRDKYKALGEHNHHHRKNNTKWSVEETVKLIRFIEEIKGQRFLHKKAEKKLARKKSQDKILGAELVIGKNRSKYNDVYKGDGVMLRVGKYIDYGLARSIKFDDIQWTDISKWMKTRSKDDCRNRWNFQVYNFIFTRFDEYSRKEDHRLIDQIMVQDVESDREILWGGIANGRSVQENKYRWERLKKLVNSRYFKSTNEVLDGLKEYFDSRRERNSEADKSKSESVIADPTNDLVELYRSIL